MFSEVGFMGVIFGSMGYVFDDAGFKGSASLTRVIGSVVPL